MQGIFHDIAQWYLRTTCEQWNASPETMECVSINPLPPNDIRVPSDNGMRGLR